MKLQNEEFCSILIFIQKALYYANIVQFSIGSFIQKLAQSFVKNFCTKILQFPNSLNFKVLSKKFDQFLLNSGSLRFKTKLLVVFQYLVTFATDLITSQCFSSHQKHLKDSMYQSQHANSLNLLNLTRLHRSAQFQSTAMTGWLGNSEKPLQKSEKVNQ